mmetsp:Transcript_20064/g.46738  ORF Transcript_20064/g.46738 Transcript_20064/m.46738 type:complete len:97 (-) Transcript_20064:18-308(-)
MVAPHLSFRAKKEGFATSAPCEERLQVLRLAIEYESPYLFLGVCACYYEEPKDGCATVAVRKSSSCCPPVSGEHHDDRRLQLSVPFIIYARISSEL